MKHFLKEMTCILLLLAVMLTVLSCNTASSRKIAVRSTDYHVSELKASELSNEYLEKYSGDEYAAYVTYVSKTNAYGDMSEELVINNERDSLVHIQNSVGGFFVGLDYSEFASGVYFVPCSGSNNKEQKLLENRCVGLFNRNSPDGHFDDFCYAIISWNYFDEDMPPVQLYKLFPPNDDGACHTEMICEIAADSAVAAVQIEHDVFYIATASSMYKVNPEGEVTEIQVPAAWLRLRINSMVAIDDMIYIGSNYGVLQYSIQQDIFTWFPVEYEDVIK